jgi:hypothetical protein
VQRHFASKRREFLAARVKDISAIGFEKLPMGLQHSIRTLPARALRHLASLPAEVALRLINTPPVERRLSERFNQVRSAHSERLPGLSAADIAIVQAVERDGVYVTSLHALGIPATVDMFAQATELSEILGRRSADSRPTRSASASDLMSHPAIFEWGMSNRLLGIVEAYLGVPVAYDGLCYFHSLPDGKETGIRLWHLDREDRRMIKIGIYVTDVGEADGPLQIVSRSASRRLEPKAYRYKPFTHEELVRRLEPAAISTEITTVTGLAGTVIFMDSAQHLHRGSPPTAQARSAIYYSYFGRPPRHPFFCERSPFTRAQLTALAESATPYQRAALQWRSSLTRSGRWLPRSRV